MCLFFVFFFFKQKTAYEIGLGIPAEPLFRSRASKITCRRSDVMSKGKKRSGARPGRPQPLRGTKGKRKGARLWYVGGRSEERFSRNAETDLVCRLLLEKKKNKEQHDTVEKPVTT